MSWLDWAVLAGIALWLAGSVVWLRRRKDKGCCGDCASCTQNCKK